MWTAVRLQKSSLRYNIASLFKHLKVIIESLYIRCSLTGGQLISETDGEIWSNFEIFVMILHAKFCTAWSFCIFAEDVFNQTDEQYNLLITNAEIIMWSISRRKLCLTLFIWQCLVMHEDTSLPMYWAYVRLVSKITLGSFTLETGEICLRKREWIPKGAFKVTDGCQLGGTWLFWVDQKADFWAPHCHLFAVFFNIVFTCSSLNVLRIVNVRFQVAYFWRSRMSSI